MSRTEAIISHATLFIFTISSRIILLGTSFPALSLENEYRWKKYIFRVNLTKTLLFKMIMHYFQELSLILHTWTGDCSVQRFAVFFLEREHCKQIRHLCKKNFDFALIGNKTSTISLIISKRGAKSWSLSSLTNSAHICFYF